MTVAAATFAVIGGSGFYEIEGLTGREAIAVDTPFGPPSDRVVLGSLDGVRMAFLPRHGVGHRLLPGEIPQQANIWALASLGVEYIVSVSAVGSLREQIVPLHMVVPDQLIDRTRGERELTFFGRGIVAHIALDAPFCPTLSATLRGAARSAGSTAHDGGTLVVIEGPAFSTRAESELYRSWGADIIGMTALPEAKLAREAGICYAVLACVTDYDTWHDGHEAVSVQMVFENLTRNVTAARGIVAATARALPARTCACATALSNAIVTPMHLVPDDVRRDLAPILDRARAPQPASGGGGTGRWGVTVVEQNSAAMPGATEYLVRAVRDPAEIRRLLEGRRPYAAYALGQLEPALFRQTNWWLSSGATSQGLMLHSRGGLGNATFAMGEARALDALLRVHPGPRHTFLTCEPHHLETMLRHFDLEQRQTMIRMHVTSDPFRPIDGPVRRLTGADARAINRLYRTDGVPSYYSARQIDESAYFGVERDGLLIAVAGTHVISRASRIAVVGNVYTHPRYRGQHFAQCTTSAVTEHLLATCDDIVLSVDPTNAPAVRAYERLGYTEAARLIEGAATRRDALGATALLRRAVARLRGRNRRGEVVRIRAPERR